VSELRGVGRMAGSKFNIDSESTDDQWTEFNRQILEDHKREMIALWGEAAWARMEKTSGKETKRGGTD